MTGYRFGEVAPMIWFGAATTAVLVVGLMYPYGFPLFSVVLGLNLLAFLASGRSIRIPVIFPFYLLVFFLLLSLIITSGAYGRPMNDVVNAVTVTALVVLLSSTLNDAEDVRKFQTALAFVIWTAGIGVAALGLWKVHLLSQGTVLEQFRAADGTYRLSTSLPKDYNFFALGQIAALISGWHIFRTSGASPIRLGFLCSVPLLVASVALSGSRRGVLILAMIVGTGFLLLAGAGVAEALRRHPLRTPRSPFATLLRVAVVLALPVLIVLGARVLLMLMGLDEVRSTMLRLATLQDFGSVATSRTALWGFGFRETYDYGVGALLLGGGFDYLGVYATQFSPEVREFTPHNMILAAFLSGGVVTLGTLLWLLIRSAGAYARNRVDLPLLLPVTAVSIPFAMTSLHLIFSFSLFLVLVMFPLLADFGSSRGRGTDRPPHSPELS
jgi:hypothetical protein